MTRLRASSPQRLRLPSHPAARSSLRGLLGSGRQRLEIRNDVAPMLGVWNTDDHFCPVNIGRGVLQEFIERLLVPRDVRRFQGRREIVPDYGSPLPPDNSGERRTDLIDPRLRRITHPACCPDSLLSA